MSGSVMASPYHAYLTVGSHDRHPHMYIHGNVCTHLVSIKTAMPKEAPGNMKGHFGFLFIHHG